MATESLQSKGQNRQEEGYTPQRSLYVKDGDIEDELNVDGSYAASKITHVKTI